MARAADDAVRSRAALPNTLVHSPEQDIAERVPALRLRHLIARYGGYRFALTEPLSIRGLPSRHVTLMIGLGARFDIAGAGCFGSFAGGLHPSSANVRTAGLLEGLHVVVRPLGMRALLGMPAAALAGQVVHLGDVLGRAADEIGERMKACRGWQERFDVLDEVFLRRLKERAVEPSLAWAWHRLIAARGRKSIVSLAGEIGWSRRHFTERFGTEFGITPKSLARIVRFERACALIKRAPARLADVAAACGYHDQAHLTREWIALAGCTPRVWIAEELPFLQDYELAAMHAEA